MHAGDDVVQPRQPTSEARLAVEKDGVLCRDETGAPKRHYQSVLVLICRIMQDFTLATASPGLTGPQHPLTCSLQTRPLKLDPWRRSVTVQLPRARKAYSDLVTGILAATINYHITVPTHPHTYRHIDVIGKATSSRELMDCVLGSKSHEIRQPDPSTIPALCYVCTWEPFIVDRLRRCGGSVTTCGVERGDGMGVGVGVGVGVVSEKECWEGLTTYSEEVGTAEQQ